MSTFETLLHASLEARINFIEGTCGCTLEDGESPRNHAIQHAHDFNAIFNQDKLAGLVIDLLDVAGYPALLAGILAMAHQATHLMTTRGDAPHDLGARTLAVFEGEFAMLRFLATTTPEQRTILRAQHLPTRTVQ